MAGKDLAVLSILTRRQTPAEIGLPPAAAFGEEAELAALADALLRASVAELIVSARSPEPPASPPRDTVL